MNNTYLEQPRKSNLLFLYRRDKKFNHDFSKATLLSNEGQKKYIINMLKDYGYIFDDKSCYDRITKLNNLGFGMSNIMNCASCSTSYSQFSKEINSYINDLL